MVFSVSFNSFGNMPPRGVDPDTYAQQYADKKGISLEEAKQELRSKFGDPKKPKKSQQTDETSALFVKAQTPISPRGVDPDTYAQQYADKKGISLEEAKQELRTKFGDPKKPKESQQTDETSALFVKAQTPISPRGVDSDTYAQQYADKKGISLEEAKQELRTKFGDPKQPEATNDSQLSFGGSSKMPPEEYELLLRGIPLSVIEQGDDAIKNYADENNIELPEKKVGRSLDIFV